MRNRHHQEVHKFIYSIVNKIKNIHVHKSRKRTNTKQGESSWGVCVCLWEVLLNKLHLIYQKGVYYFESISILIRKSKQTVYDEIHTWCLLLVSLAMFHARTLYRISKRKHMNIDMFDVRKTQFTRNAKHLSITAKWYDSLK